MVGEKKAGTKNKGHTGKKKKAQEADKKVIIAMDPLAQMTAVHDALISKYSISDGNGGIFPTPLQGGPTGGANGLDHSGLLMSQEELDAIDFDKIPTHGLDMSMVDFDPNENPKEFHQHDKTGTVWDVRQPLDGAHTWALEQVLGVDGGQGGGKHAQQGPGVGQRGHWEGMTEQDVLNELCRVEEASRDLNSPEALGLIPEVNLLGTHPYPKQPRAPTVNSKAGRALKPGSNAIPQYGAGPYGNMAVGVQQSGETRRGTARGFF